MKKLCFTLATGLLLSVSLACFAAPDTTNTSSATGTTGAPSAHPATKGRPTTTTLSGCLPEPHFAALVTRADTILRGAVIALKYAGDRVLTTVRSAEGYLTVAHAGILLQGEELPAGAYLVPAEKLTFKVESCLKGASLAQGSVITVEVYDFFCYPVWQMFEAGQHGLLLLDSNGAISNLNYPLLPISSTPRRCFRRIASGAGGRAVSGPFVAADHIARYAGQRVWKVPVIWASCHRRPILSAH